MVLSVLVALILSPALDRRPCSSARTRRAQPGGSTGAFRRSRAWSQRAQDWFNDGFERLVDRYRRRGQRAWSTASGCSSAIYARDRARCSSCCSCACRPASCRPRTRARPASSSACPPGATPGPHARGAARRSRTISSSHESKNVRTLCSPSPAAAAAAAAAARTPARASSTSRTGTSARARRTAPTPSSQRAPAALPQLPRRAGLRAGPRRDPRPRPVERLHAWSCRTRSGMSRDAVRGGARPAARRGARRSGSWRRCGSSELPDVATLKVDVEPQKLAALGLRPGRCQHDAVDRLGRPLRQRLHRSRPGQARLCPGRRAVSRRRPRTIDQWYVRSADGRDGAVLVLRADRLGDGAEQPVALPGRPRLRDSRARRRRATARARR